MVAFPKTPIAIFAGFFIASRFCGENLPHIDQIVGNHAQSNPSAHAIQAPIPTRSNPCRRFKTLIRPSLPVRHF